MSNPIFYFAPLRSSDKWSIALYMVVSAVVISVYRDARLELFLYVVSTQVLLYVIGYRSLRNLSVYFIWIAIALGHFSLYYLLQDDVTKGTESFAIAPFRSTLPLLLLFQVLRFISARVQGQELVAPSRGSRTDLFNERTVNWVDVILFMIYLGCVVWGIVRN